MPLTLGWILSLSSTALAEDPAPVVAEPASVETAAVAWDTSRYGAPADLVPGSGTGYAQDTVFVPGMRFPIEEANAQANSQVYGHGGMNGPGGAQCDAANYAFPWRDNFCETRGYSTPMCPAGTGHQGQDIRPPTCKKGVYWAVAAEAGTISAIGSYSVTLMSDSGTVFRYLHLDMKQLAVRVGDVVPRGGHIGLVSNDFNDTPTTIHLHFEIKQSVALPNGRTTITFVPPYTSLVDAHERLVAGTP